MEKLRSIKITAEIDTNKDTHKFSAELADCASFEEMLSKFIQFLNENLDRDIIVTER